jgi:hypothetical protein
MGEGVLFLHPGIDGLGEDHGPAGADELTHVGRRHDRGGGRLLDIDESACKK